jgi:hypothetical protein
MADLTVNRTLVKSPPELWSEVSEVESLAHHLGEFGEIAISRLQPEHTVAWEGEHARGTVELEESGWGTKVTLSADLAVVEAEPVPEPDPEPVAEEVRLPWYRRLFGRSPAPAPEPVPEPEPDEDPETVIDPVRATAVLEDTLDHLGAAHHRPFSPRQG